MQAFQPPYLGGEQERGLRPGTENLPYALGLAAAATRLAGSIKSRDKAVRALNDRLRAGFLCSRRWRSTARRALCLRC